METWNANHIDFQTAFRGQLELEVPSCQQETAKRPRPSRSDLLRFIFFEENSNGSWELKWGIFQALAIIIGVIMIIIFSGYHKPFGKIFAVSILLAGVALAIGLLVGFLFGVPKAAGFAAGTNTPAAGATSCTTAGAAFSPASRRAAATASKCFRRSILKPTSGSTR